MAGSAAAARAESRQVREKMNLIRVFAIVALSLAALAAPAQERLGMPEWYWTELPHCGQLALWHNCIQVGGYIIETGTYLPRIAPGRWGVPEDPPCDVPEKYLRQLDARKNWRTQGIVNPEGKHEVPHTGLHIRQVAPKTQPKLPKSVPAVPPRKVGAIQDYSPAALAAGAEQVPDYSAMPSLTFVAKDPAVADAALHLFQTAPELATWRDKYGARAKAYGYDDFQHTSYGFKLDEDKQFQAGGFVAFAQPAPDADGRAVVRKPIYEFSSAQQFAAALRDADPDYNPNPPSGPGAAAEWEPWQLYTAGGSIAGAIVLLSAVQGLRARRKRAGLM